MSQSRLASEVGASVLGRGGNAIDAAVAAAFALAVTHPEAGNLGGGGFLVAHLPSGRATTFDFRERAPLTAHPRMFAGPGGSYDPERHHWSHLAVGVPGTVAGLELAHRRLGRLPWRELVQPAVDLAASGFAVSEGLAASLALYREDFARHPATLAQFTREGRPYRAGEILRQPDLSRTLEAIRDRGASGFYRGETADLLVREMERGGGLVTREDLERYEAVERPPLRGTYGGFEVVSMGPPSSGGVALIEMLNVLAGHDLAALGLRSARECHLIAEAMRRAYADRARFLGDPDFTAVPVERLTSKAHAAGLRATIDPDRASRSSPERFDWPSRGGETTHLSAADASGLAVALTTTLEQAYGARIVVPGAGFLLNNEMGDFNPVPGRTDATGLIGTLPNLVAPGKRMLSSMTPAILARDGKPRLVLGSPGGRTIINTVLLVVVNFVDHGLSAEEAVDRPRFHHQWLPDRIEAEAGCFSPAVRKRLEAMGHRIVARRAPQGSVMAVAAGEDGTFEPACDRRRPGAAAAGE